MQRGKKLNFKFTLGRILGCWSNWKLFSFPIFLNFIFHSRQKVKRQAVLEIQRAVSAAETRAIDMIAQERIKMEKIYGEINRPGDGIDGEHQTTGTNVRMNNMWKYIHYKHFAINRLVGTADGKQMKPARAAT